MSIELSVFARASILLLGTTLLVSVLRKASASTRHTVWVIGLIAALILPVASLLLPSLNLPVLTDSKTTTTSAPLDVPVSTAALTSSITQASPLRLSPDITIAAEPSAEQSSATTAENPVAQAWPRRQWIILLWILGTLTVFLRASLGFREVRRLEASSRRILDDWGAQILVGLTESLSISAPVELRIGNDAVPPMTWGVFRHTILFPTAALEWTGNRIRLVIAHELAHVKRRDGLTQILVHAACAVYWFNPLVWYAAYRMRIERECACDDQVLNFGVDADDYADQLLGIARGVNKGWASAALSMVDVSHFETRLRAILDATKNRQKLSHASVASLFCSTAVLTILLGTTHLTTFAMPAGPQMLIAKLSPPAPLKSALIITQRTVTPLQPRTSSSTAVLVGMDFIKVAPGTFMMGCSSGDTDCKDDEKPSHRVRITKGFEMGKDEVTQAQWQTVMGTNPSTSIGADLPVETVGWDDVQAFLQKLNERHDGYRYRLPTEAEWEYAARARSIAAVPASLDTIAWYANNSGKDALDSVLLWKTDQRDFGPRIRDNQNQTHPVGLKSANAWGLHDMLGNVQEMVQDWYGANYYQMSPTADPAGPLTGAQHVARGGWFGSSGLNSDSTARVSSRQRFSNGGEKTDARAVLNDLAAGATAGDAKAKDIKKRKQLDELATKLAVLTSGRSTIGFRCVREFISKVGSEQINTSLTLTLEQTALTGNLQTISSPKDERSRVHQRARAGL